MFISFINLIIKDLKLIIRNKQLMVTCFTLPFLILLLFSYMFSGGMERKQGMGAISVAVVDTEDSIFTRLLLQNFTENKSFDNFIKLEVCSEAEAIKKFDDEELTGIIKIPVGFSNSIINGNNYPIDVRISDVSPIKAKLLKEILEGYGRYIQAVQSSVTSSFSYIEKLQISSKEKDALNQKLSIDLVTDALGREVFFQNIVDNDLPSSSSSEYFMITILILFLMYIGISSGNFIIYEKNSSCLNRLKISPVPMLLVVFAKWCAFLIFSFIYSLIFILPAISILKLYFGNSFQNMVIFIALVIGFMISMFMFLGVIFKKEETYMLFSNLYVLLAAIIGGSFIPLYMMPPAVQQISKLTPNYWCTKGLLYLMNDYTFEDIKVITLGLILLTFVFLSLTAMLHSRKGVTK